MLSFYRRAAALFFVALASTIVLVVMGLMLSSTESPLLPNKQSDIYWHPGIEPKAPNEATYVSVLREDELIDYNFYLSSAQPYPYTSYIFNFTDAYRDDELIDLRHFDYITFEARCDPRNIMLFVLFTFDEKSTDLKNSGTYRVNSTFFSCDNEWRDVKISLHTLDTPDWWLQQAGLELVDRQYLLDKVISFAFVNSRQSPRDTDSNIKVKNIVLKGEERSYLYTCLVLALLVWIAYALWFARRYLKELVDQVKDKMKQDQPFIAYKKLSIEPQRDKEKTALLKHLASEYANPDISLESTVSSLGINRNKINEILKDELGLTFSAYLNKLRLTEAARLLSEQIDMNIAQIAYAVGFNNVTYFNKLFKNEYGCTPKMFKNNCQPEEKN